MFQKLVLSVLVLLLLAVPRDSHADAGDEANSHFKNGDWPAAAEAYRALAEQAPEDGRTWFRLGYSLHQLEDYDRAAEAYEAAHRLGWSKPLAAFNLACTYSRSGNHDKAIDSGFGGLKNLESDTDLDPIRNDPRFVALVLSADRNSRPCEYDDRHRRLDFWIGTWDVFDQSGTRVGGNVIEKKVNGCLIQENWTSANGTEGKSLNYFDPKDSLWKQQWVDWSGHVISYSGEFRDGALFFEGESVPLEGEGELSRMVLRPNDEGHVHQLIEQSKDGGESWYVWFDGIYVPAD